MAGIVSSQFVSPHPFKLSIVRKLFSLTKGNFAVSDVQGNPLFRLRDHLFCEEDHRVLLDGNGAPVVTLHKRIPTIHNRWKVFKGESMDERNSLFTVKMSSKHFFSVRPELDVFFTNNKDEKVCDYKIKGHFMNRSFTVYVGETSNIVAQMDKSMTAGKVDMTHFNITVNQNVDYAFITALIVTFIEIIGPV